MNVETITMDPDEAQEQLEEYAKALRRRADEEYEAVRTGLEALAAGDAVLNLTDAIRQAPVDDAGRPMLAVGRADRRQVAFTWANGTIARFATKTWRDRGLVTDTMVRNIDMGRGHGRTQIVRPRSGDPYHITITIEGYALVPMVPPPGLRLAGGFSGLRHHFVLWEVEAWSDTPIGAVPDRDPYLLKHLGGDLYAVVYEWDLTDLERAVMAGRRHG